MPTQSSPAATFQLYNTNAVTKLPMTQLQHHCHTDLTSVCLSCHAGPSKSHNTNQAGAAFDIMQYAHCLRGLHSRAAHRKSLLVIVLHAKAEMMMGQHTPSIFRQFGKVVTEPPESCYGLTSIKLSLQPSPAVDGCHK